MVTDLYAHYLWLIGTLKDSYKLHVDADHKDIHTFYKERQPLFKLFFGRFDKNNVDSIVVSFHIDLISTVTISWFMILQNLHPPISLTEVFIEDATGESYIGEDAVKIRDLKIQQKVLKLWETSKKKEIKEFIDSKVVGRVRTKKVFNASSSEEVQKAITDFELLKLPTDDGEVQ